MANKEALLSRWDDLKVFLAIATHGSLSEAARYLEIDQSTLSRRLTSFEEEISAVLFERTRTGCILTPIGERVLDEARAVERSAHGFLDAVKQEDTSLTGLVRIATTEGLAIHFLIPEVLPVLQKKYPGIAMELVTGTAPADLLRHEADVALRFFRETEGDLTIKKLGKLRRAILVGKCRKKTFARQKPEELPWVAGALDAREGLWIRELGVSELQLKTSSYEAQLAAITAGLAVGIGPSLLCQLSTELDTLSPPFPTPPPLEVFLVTRRSARRTPRVRAVAELLSTEMRSLFLRDSQS